MLASWSPEIKLPWIAEREQPAVVDYCVWLIC